MAKNSIVIICKNIKIDKNYQNCLTYSETNMYQLCYSNKVNMANNFSFIREETNTLRVPFTYEECLSSNYMAFQNPRYSNKWFFAFIDSVEYVSDGATNINFTVDEFSTWWSYWDPVQTFVIREHTNDDTIGSNLVDEGLGLGDFVCNKVNDNLQPFTGFKPVIGVSEILLSKNHMANVPDFYENGNIFSGICYIIGDSSPTMTSNIVKAYDENGKAGDIQYIFMAPVELFDNRFVDWYSATDFGYTVNFGIILSTYASYGVDFGGNSFLKPVSLDGYTPVNNKLLTSPYSYLLVDPHDGNNYKFNYEDFSNSFYSFSVDAVLTPGCSVKFTPTNYKGILKNYAYSFAGVKFPMCSWNSDAYTNWLTQNGVNLGFTTLNQQEAMGVGGIGALAIGGLLMATGIGGMIGAGLMMGGATGIFSSMQSDYKASMLPDQVKGNQSTGDINFTLDLVNPLCYEMSIKEEKARSIDEYFTRFGYKTNRLKVPNQTGRLYFNYVEIGKSEIIGYPKITAGIPADSMEKINNIYRSGVTLWHDHSRIGNYAGNIISNPPQPTPETTVFNTTIHVDNVNSSKGHYITLFGNTSQNGTPTPENPVPIQVVTGDVIVEIANSNYSQRNDYLLSLGDLEVCKIEDYQDYFYKENGTWYLHEEIGKVVLDGSENWGDYSGQSLTNTILFGTTIIDDIGKVEYISLSNYFENKDVSLWNNDVEGITISSLSTRQLRVRINKTLANSITNFKTWLSTHNTIVYYVLATANEREITDNNLIQQLDRLYTANLYSGTTNINSITSNLNPYIQLHYNI